MAPTQITEARGWLRDIGIRTHDLSDQQVLLIVARTYDGGLSAFDLDTRVLVLVTA